MAGRWPSRSGCAATQSSTGRNWRSASGTATTGDSPVPTLSMATVARPWRSSCSDSSVISSFQASTPPHITTTCGRTTPWGRRT